MKAALFSLVFALAATASQVPPEFYPSSKEELVAITQTFLFNCNMSDFLSARDRAFSYKVQPQTYDHGHWLELDWKSDGCSDSLNLPFNFNWLPACQRHDFGYRNYRIQSRFTEESRDLLDRLLHKDMKAECEIVHGEIVGERGERKFQFEVCLEVANRFYLRMVKLGDDAKRSTEEMADLEEVEKSGGVVDEPESQPGLWRPRDAVVDIVSNSSGQNDASNNNMRATARGLDWMSTKMGMKETPIKNENLEVPVDSSGYRWQMDFVGGWMRIKKGGLLERLLCRHLE